MKKLISLIMVMFIALTTLGCNANETNLPIDENPTPISKEHTDVPSTTTTTTIATTTTTTSTTKSTTTTKSPKLSLNMKPLEIGEISIEYDGSVLYPSLEDGIKLFFDKKSCIYISKLEGGIVGFQDIQAERILSSLGEGLGNSYGSIVQGEIQNITINDKPSYISSSVLKYEDLLFDSDVIYTAAVYFTDDTTYIFHMLSDKEKNDFHYYYYLNILDSVQTIKNSHNLNHGESELFDVNGLSLRLPEGYQLYEKEWEDDGIVYFFFGETASQIILVRSIKEECSPYTYAQATAKQLTDAVLEASFLTSFTREIDINIDTMGDIEVLGVKASTFDIILAYETDLDDVDEKKFTGKAMFLTLPDKSTWIFAMDLNPSNYQVDQDLSYIVESLNELNEFYEYKASN